MKEKTTAHTRITQGKDGKYRWAYEMDLFRNPTVFLLVWKIFFCIFAGIFLFVTLIESADHHFQWDAFLTTVKPFGYVFLGMTALVALGYLLYAAIMGGKYCVEFEMDENGLTHKQTAAQAKKAKKLGKATMFAGAAAGRFETIAAGVNAGQTELYSDFSKVKKVKAYPRRHLIRVNGFLDHNQVYAAKEDFAFVHDYIIAHCPHLKNKR